MQLKISDKLVTTLAFSAVFAAMVSAGTYNKEFLNGATSGVGLYSIGSPANTTVATSGTVTTRESDGEVLTFDGASTLYIAAISNGAYDNPTPYASDRFEDLYKWVGSITSGVLTTTTDKADLVTILDDNYATRSIGLGGIDASGVISLRLDNGTGTPHAVGVVSTGNSSLDRTLGNTSGTPNITLVNTQGGSGYSDTLYLPSVKDIHGNLAWISNNTSATILYSVGAGAGTSGSQWGSGQVVVIPSGNQFRGSLSYNAAKDLYSVLRYNTTTKKVDAVYVFKIVQDPFTLAYTSQDLTGANGAMTVVPLTAVIGGTSTQLYGANYFGRVVYGGQPQVAMNDNGDIAVTCQPASGNTRYILFNKLTSGAYAATSTVAATISAFTNPAASYVFAVGQPALDNSDNLYFEAATAAPATTTSVVNNALFKAVYSGGSFAAPVKLLKTGDVISQGGANARTITFMPTQDTGVYGSGGSIFQTLSGSSIQNPSPSAIGPNSIDRVNGRLVMDILTQKSGSSSMQFEYVVLEQ